MQEGEFDYSTEEFGCCLSCEDSKQGCLCYECKCTQCYHYTNPDESFCHDNEGNEKGVCDIAISNHLKKREKEKRISEHFSKDAINYTMIGLKKGQTQLSK